MQELQLIVSGLLVIVSMVCSIYLFVQIKMVSKELALRSPLIVLLYKILFLRLIIDVVISSLLFLNALFPSLSSYCVWLPVMFCVCGGIGTITPGNEPTKV